MQKRSGCLTAAAALMGLLMLLIYWLWRGAPLKADDIPAPISGTVYYLQRQPDDLLAVMRRPADLSRPAEKVVHRAGCPEQNCNIARFYWTGNGLEYIAMNQGQWYRWRDGRPLRPDDGKPEGEPPLQNARRVMGSLVLHGTTVLEHPGVYDFKFAPGYAPERWIGGGERFMLFHYNGYAYGVQSLLANMLGPGRGRGGTYIYDFDSLRVHRFTDGFSFIWQP